MHPLFYLSSIFVLSFLLSCVQAQQLTFEKRAEGVEVHEGGKKVLFYQASPRSLNGQYERANYIHPLYGLDGVVLTEDFPADHPHHRGIFWAWHQILYKDKPIADGWSCENISWEVTDSDVQRKKNSVSIINQVMWKSLIDGGEATNIVREKSVITVYSARSGYRIIDFDIALYALVDSLKIGGSTDAKGYGGFSVRFKLPQDIVFQAKDKTVQAQENAVIAGPWLDFNGSFANHGRAGVTIFCHPSNPGYPEPWILRSKASMQNPAWPGRTAVDLRHSGVRLRYRLVIHDEKLLIPAIEQLFREYNNVQ